MPQTILITGCSSGIGQASARRFAAAGWNVIATQRDPAQAGDLADLPNVLIQRLDVQDQASIAQAIAEGIARFGRIDALVNNAGYGQYGIFEAVPREKVIQQFDVNVFGVMDVIRAILPHFRANRAGTIINVSSGAGLFTLPMISLYSASKFALEGFSEALSYELAELGIAVKIVIPHAGITSTKFHERSFADHVRDKSLDEYEDFIERMGVVFGRMIAARMIEADDVAKMIEQAATDGSDRLRYLIGDDARGFVRARRELPEEEYVAFMRNYFSA
ncbi:SDR family oxidoreductase [Dongia sp.]|uniref:SDR family oxidoreductase n=1 Tax=Dongia sp. TaxID=1977262 RepID=UPI0035AE75D5